MRVLVIDPSLPVRARLVARLRDAGLHVVGEGGSGAEAVRLASAHGPDAVILDVRLPDQRGLDALGRLKALAPAPAVLVLTNEVAYRDLCLARGADAFLDKSMDFDAVESTLRSFRRDER